MDSQPESMMPKHAHLKSRLVSMILDGTWESGRKVPSEAQLSKRYGVSRTTVIRALRDMEREGLVTRRQGAGTFVHSDVADQTTIGALIPGLAAGDIFLSVQRHLFRQSSRFNWQILSGEVLLPGDNDAAGHAPIDAAKKLVQSGVSGVVLVPHHIDGMIGRWNETMLNVFRDAKTPVVLLDRDYLEAPHRSAYDLVSLDNSRAGFELACHLLERDRKEFLFIGDPHAYSSSYGRLSGIRKALSLHELSLPDHYVLEGTEQGIAQSIKRVKKGDVDAVVCNSDHDAALLMRDCVAEGLNIPEDIAIVGFDDQPIARLLSTPLTTVAQPAEALAICAITTLRDRINFPDLPPRTVRVQGELIVRDST